MGRDHAETRLSLAARASSDGNEVKATLEVLKSLDLKGCTVTADALHCQRNHAATILEKGGDYLLQIKANQENLLKKAQALDGLKSTPFLPKPEPGTAV